VAIQPSGGGEAAKPVRLCEALPLLRAAPTLQLAKNELNVVRFAQALHE